MRHVIAQALPVGDDDDNSGTEAVHLSQVWSARNTVACVKMLVGRCLLRQTHMSIPIRLCQRRPRNIYAWYDGRQGRSPTWLWRPSCRTEPSLRARRPRVKGEGKEAGTNPVNIWMWSSARRTCCLQSSGKATICRLVRMYSAGRGVKCKRTVCQVGRTTRFSLRLCSISIRCDSRCLNLGYRFNTRPSAGRGCPQAAMRIIGEKLKLA